MKWVWWRGGLQTRCDAHRTDRAVATDRRHDSAWTDGVNSAAKIVTELDAVRRGEHRWVPSMSRRLAVAARPCDLFLSFWPFSTQLGLSDSGLRR